MKIMFDRNYCKLAFASKFLNNSLFIIIFGKGDQFKKIIIMNAISVRFFLSFCINNNYKSNKYFDVQNCTNLMNLTKNYFYKHKVNKHTYLWNNKK